MSTNARTGLKATCGLGMCLEVDWFPHAVQVALAADRMDILGREGGAITLQEMIVARDAAEKVVRVLSMRRGHRGIPLHQSEGAREQSNCSCMKRTLWSLDGYLLL